MHRRRLALPRPGCQQERPPVPRADMSRRIESLLRSSHVPEDFIRRKAHLSEILNDVVESCSVISHAFFCTESHKSNWLCRFFTNPLPCHRLSLSACTGIVEMRNAGYGEYGGHRHSPSHRDVTYSTGVRFKDTSEFRTGSFKNGNWLRPTPGVF
jgi:hypothetical protein